MLQVKGIEIDGQVIKFSSLSPKTDVHNSTLYVTTYSEVTYPLDPFDVTLNPLSAVQIQAKMISQERAKGLFPEGLYRRGNFSCKYVNEVHDFFVIPFCPYFNLSMKLVLPYLSCISIVGENVENRDCPETRIPEKKIRLDNRLLNSSISFCIELVFIFCS